MSDCFSPDNQITTDAYFAAFCVYLGFTLIRVETEPLREGTKGTKKFTLRIPEHDFELCKAEFADPNTSIYLTGFISAENIVRSCINHSFKNGGGVWQWVPKPKEVRR